MLTDTYSVSAISWLVSKVARWLSTRLHRDRSGALAFNTFFVLVSNWLGATHDVPLPAALGTAAAGLLLDGMAGLAWGRLSDRAGRRTVCVVTATLLTILAVPLMRAADHGGLFGLAVVVGVLRWAAHHGNLAEMFPAPRAGDGDGPYGRTHLGTGRRYLAGSARALRHSAPTACR